MKTDRIRHGRRFIRYWRRYCKTHRCRDRERAVLALAEYELRLRKETT